MDILDVVVLAGRRTRRPPLKIEARGSNEPALRGFVPIRLDGVYFSMFLDAMPWSCVVAGSHTLCDIITPPRTGGLAGSHR